MGPHHEHHNAGARTRGSHVCARAGVLARGRAPRRLLRLALLLALAPNAAAAQLISLRPVPLAAGDQFLTFPSARLGMAGVSIALDDAFADPFANPAKLARLNRSFVYSAPASSDVTRDENGLRTLPAGVMLRVGDWFGAAAGAVQRIETRSSTDIVWPGPTPEGAPAALAGTDAVNGYGFALIGRRIATDFAVAASASYADLNAVDGVDVMYPLSRGVQQYGHVAGFRVGVLADSENGKAAELLVLHDRFDVRHDVTYLDWRWDASARQPLFTTRLQRNVDRTETWGLHAGYRWSITGSPWRLGAILTANRKTHRGIPDYGLVDIPHDPGHSWAYDVGIGLARVAGASTLGIDLVFEPIRSRTRALANDTLRTASGRLLEAGDVAADNRFSFSNAILRLGAAHETDRFGVQLGLGVRSIRYDLDRHDRIVERIQTQHEQWIEWTPTWGAALTFPDLEIRYAGRLTTGTGEPTMRWTGAIESLRDSPVNSFVVAPAGPPTLQQSRVTTHQITIALPLRH